MVDTKDAMRIDNVSFAIRYCDTVTYIMRKDCVRTQPPTKKKISMKARVSKLKKGSLGKEARKSPRKSRSTHIRATSSLIYIPSTYHEDLRHCAPRCSRNCRCWKASTVGKITAMW